MTGKVPYNQKACYKWDEREAMWLFQQSYHAIKVLMSNEKENNRKQGLQGSQVPAEDGRSFMVGCKFED